MHKLIATTILLMLGCSKDPAKPAEAAAKPVDKPMPTATTPVAPAPAAMPAAPSGPKTLELDVKRHDKAIKVKVKVPGELTAGDAMASLRETNSGEFLTGIQFSLTCDGACGKGLADNLAKFVAGAPDRASKPNYNTGDAKLDAVRLDVKTVDQGDIPDGKFVVYRVKKQAGLEDPYREHFEAVCARLLPDKSMFVSAYAYTMLDTEKSFGPQMVEACKTFEIM